MRKCRIQNLATFSKLEMQLSPFLFCNFLYLNYATNSMDKAFCGEGNVVSLHDGSFIAEGPENRNVKFNMGPTAVLNFGNIDMIVCKSPSGNGDPQLFRHFGIEPTLYDVIEVKANSSFREPYSKFTDEFYYVDVYGASSANLKRFKWENLPHNMYPFDLPEDYVPEPAKIIRKKHS